MLATWYYLSIIGPAEFTILQLKVKIKSKLVQANIPQCIRSIWSHRAIWTVNNEWKAEEIAMLKGKEEGRDVVILANKQIQNKYRLQSCYIYITRISTATTVAWI